MNSTIKKWPAAISLAATSLLCLQGCGGFEAHQQKFSPTRVQANVTDTDENRTQSTMCSDEVVLTCGDTHFQLRDADGCRIAACVPVAEEPDADDGGDDSGSETGDDSSQDTVAQPDPPPVPETYGFIQYIAAWKRIGGDQGWSAISKGGTGGTPMTKTQAESYCRTSTQKSKSSTGIPLSSSDRAYLCIFILADNEEYTEEQGDAYEVIGYKRGVADALRSMCGKALSRGETHCAIYNSIARPESNSHGLFLELVDRESSNMDRLANMFN